MHTNTIIVNDYFEVNGVRCFVQLDGQSLVWTKYSGTSSIASLNKKCSNSKQTTSVSLDKIIAIKSFSLYSNKPFDDDNNDNNKDNENDNNNYSNEKVSPNTGNSKNRAKLKVFFAKETQPANKLIKLKKLVFLNLNDSSKRINSTTQSTEIDEENCTSDADNRGASYAPNHDKVEGCLSKMYKSSLPSSVSLSSTPSTKSPLSKRSLSPSQSNNNLEFLRPIDKLHYYLKNALAVERKQRPTKLLVFVNPVGGKGEAFKTYKRQVRKLFELAKVNVKLVITQYANHARETIEDPHVDIHNFDGIICVGGDGIFSELINGLLFRINRENILTEKQLIKSSNNDINQHKIQNLESEPTNAASIDESSPYQINDSNQNQNSSAIFEEVRLLRQKFGGIGKKLLAPTIPVGIIGAGSTDANLFGFIGTNDVVTATLNIILGNQINIDVCSIHSLRSDTLLRFVSTFVAYGYFGDVIRESEKLRWLGPKRYDITGLNNVVKHRHYNGNVRILSSLHDSSPLDEARCQKNCAVCNKSNNPCNHNNYDKFKVITRTGPFVGINAAVTACRCPQTKKGFSPNNHLGNGCMDLILVSACSRLQYIKYLLRTAYTTKSAFDLNYVEAFRCRQFEFIATNTEVNFNGTPKNSVMKSDASIESSTSASSLSDDSSVLSSWNADGEIFDEISIRVKVNNKLLRVFGTGEPVLTSKK